MTPLFPLAPFLFALGALARAPSAQDESSAVKRLFSENCATCHGETGDGQGTTQLDRPARSFKDGGFSFGNTPEAIFRTLSVGIPGTPMPSFDLLREEDRRALAEYVITLGPPIEEVTVEETILAVRDRPLFVRGLLPPIAEGLPSHPRGLLVGTTDGMTFEYRVDDVRLLGVRQGDFVERTDWRGRGGTPLKPLGKVVVLIEGGKPEPTFFRGTTPLVARLSATRVREIGQQTELPGWIPTIAYHLVTPGGEVAHVEEFPRVEARSFGTGFTRDFELTPSSGGDLVVRTPSFTGARVLAAGESLGDHWQVVQPAEGPPVYVEIWSSNTARVTRREDAGQIEATVKLEPGKRGGFLMRNVVLIGWNDDVRAQIDLWNEDK